MSIIIIIISDYNLCNMLLILATKLHLPFGYVLFYLSLLLLHGHVVLLFEMCMYVCVCCFVDKII